MGDSINLLTRPNKICRICLKESDKLSPLFPDDQGQDQPKYPALVEKIRECGDIKLRGDIKDKNYPGICIIPSMICDTCIENAKISYKFRLQCQHSAKTFQLYHEELIQSNLEIVPCETSSSSQSQDLSNSTEDSQSSSEEIDDREKLAVEDEIENHFRNGDLILQQLLDTLTGPDI